MTVDFDRKPEEIIAEVEELTSHFQANDGILILTDMYGATPSNIAQHFITRENTKIIAGLNLPMLIRTLNYAHLNLNEVYEKALCGGKEGILLCESNQET
jgi:PTS system ascorbate-specific IIA component